MSGTTVDTLNQADALLTPMEITPAQYRAAERFIRVHSAGLADQRLLTQALGLDASAPEKRTSGSAARRAVPDGFRRGRRGQR